MAQGKVEICGVNTAKLPLLKSSEQEAFFARIKQGDEEARQQYIEGNLRLVLSVIRRFAGSSENLDDLFQKHQHMFDAAREILTRLASI